MLNKDSSGFMTIIFISDLHLNQNTNACPLKIKIEQLLQEYQPTALFFLGDVFEFWWGDDHNSSDYKSWEKFFCSIDSEKYFISGNRDFLCSTSFFRRTKITPLPSGSEISYENIRLALYHGDEEALQDPAYQRFRSLLRSRTIQAAWHSLPESWRFWISAQGRKRSHAPLKLHYDYSIWAQKHPQAQVLVHGHCHQQNKFQHNHLKIYTLGDCYQDRRFSALILSKNCSEQVHLDFI